MTTPATVLDLIDAAAAARVDLGVALKAMGERNAFIDLSWRYYDGDHPALWLSDKFADIFGERTVRLEDNYCALAVDAVLSRIGVTGWIDLDDTEDDTAETDDSRDGDVAEGEGAQAVRVTDADVATAVWSQDGLDLMQEDLYRHALVSHVGYVLVWPNEQGVPEAIPQDPRNVYVHYGSMRLNDIRWAAKVWHEDKRWHACLFYPDRMVRLISAQDASAAKRPEANGFVLNPDDPGGPNPLPVKDRVPMVPFDLRRGGKSWLHNLIPPQDKINKLAANKMVAAEFAAYRQRVFITTQQLPDDALENAPDRAIVMDPGTKDAPTSVHEFAVTELRNYDQAIDAEVSRFFTIARLPRHLIVGTGSAPPSGEAIKTDEGPFVAVVDRLVARWTAAWTDVMALLGLNVEPTWGDTEVHNDLSVGQTVKAFTDAGAPLPTVLRKYAAWDDAEVLEAQEALDARQAQAVAAGAAALTAFEAGVPAGTQE